MDLGPVLREARSGTGTSQQDLAKRTGLAVRTIAELESGRGDLASLDAVVQALGFHFVGLPRGTSWGERCKLLRSRSGLSLTRLAEQAGVSVPAIARLEKGEVVHVQTLSRVLRVLAPKARRRQAQTTALGLDGGRDMRFTPVAMLSKLVDPVGPFDLDPCGHPDSPVEARECFLGGPDDDGLKRDWFGTAYVNPPYSIAQAFARAAVQVRIGVTALPAFQIYPGIQALDAPRTLPRLPEIAVSLRPRRSWRSRTAPDLERLVIDVWNAFRTTVPPVPAPLCTG